MKKQAKPKGVWSGWAIKRRSDSSLFEDTPGQPEIQWVRPDSRITAFGHWKIIRVKITEIER